jgi:hypothetical protein
MYTTLPGSSGSAQVRTHLQVLRPTLYGYWTSHVIVYMHTYVELQLLTVVLRTRSETTGRAGQYYTSVGQQASSLLAMMIPVDQG